MVLPLLIHDEKTKWLYLGLGFFCTIVFYQLTNRVHIRKPILLNFDCVDRRMPFWPKTVWIYFSEYIIFGACYFNLKEWINLTRYCYTYLFVLFISCVIFALFPVTFPREKFPLDNYPDNLSKRALNFLRNHMDTPANCLPSLHVSSCFISAFAFWFENITLFTIFFIWSILVSVSTMTTKQHYFIDIWTAFLITLGSFGIFYYGVGYSSGVS